MGDVQITINDDEYNADQKWDGLKGDTTKTQLNKDEVVTHYGHLWKIEKAFRISKTDLRIRPIYHRILCLQNLQKPDRRLKTARSTLSPEKATDIANTIFKISIETPGSKSKESSSTFQMTNRSNYWNYLNPKIGCPRAELEKRAS